MSRPKRPVFISYARSTSLLAAAALQTALGGDDGLAFLDTSDIAVGARFPPEIGEALMEARVVVVFCDDAYFTRWYCLRELSLAISPFLRDSTDAGHLDHIVVALASDGGGVKELPPQLQATNWPQATEGPLIEALVRDRLDKNTQSIRERIGEAAASTAIAILVEESLVPRPRSVAGIPSFPAGLPPSIGQRFVGRADDLWRLHFVLSSLSPAHTPVGLTGSIEAMGGMGKTRLAVEYLHRFGPSLYPGGLFWINADANEDDVEAQLHGVLAVLDAHAPSLADFRQSGRDVRNALARAIQAVNKPTLFVVDNVPDPTDGAPLRAPGYWCPAVGRVSLLITSRTHVSVGTHGVHPISIDALAVDSAVLLLTEGLDRSTLPDHEWRATCEWLGRLPLAIELLNRTLKAGAISPAEIPFVRETPITPQLEECMQALRPHIALGSLRGISETFRLSFNSLPEPAKFLAALLVELAPAPIPLAFLQLFETPEIRSDLVPIPDYASPASRAALVMRSFVTPSRSALIPLYGTIHRVVADFVRSQVPPQLRKTFITGWSGGLNKIFIGHPSDNSVHWDLLDACAPHADHILKLAMAVGTSESALALGYHFGTFLLRRGQPDRAFELLSRITAATEESLGPEHDGTVACKQSLASAFIALGRTSEARSVLQDIASTATKRYGPDDRRTLTANASLSGILNDEGHSDEARELVERIIQRLQVVHAATDTELAPLFNNLGLALLSLEDFEGAAKVLERALPLLTESLTEHDNGTQACMTNLAAAWRRTGKLAEGTALVRRVYEIRSAQLGTNHPATLRSLHNLADAVAESSGLSEGIAIQRRVVDGSLGIFGTLGAPTLHAQGQLSVMLMKSRHFDEAEPMARYVAETFERVLPATHPHVLIAKNNLAQLLATLGKREEAERLLREVLTTAWRSLARPHRLSQRAYMDLVRVIAQRGVAPEDARAEVAALLSGASSTSDGTSEPGTDGAPSTAATSVTLQGGLDRHAEKSNDVASELQRGHLAFEDVRLAAPLMSGRIPQMLLTMVNDGHSTVENITGPYQALVAPSLPKCELSEFAEIQAARGLRPPKVDKFFSGSLAPSERRKTGMIFPLFATVLNAYGNDFIRTLGRPQSQSGLPTVTSRAYFFGFLDYKTLGTAYRMEFCYTPRDHAGTALEKWDQWNRTVDLAAALKGPGRKGRHVTADVVALTVKSSDDQAGLRESTKLSILFVNLGPTPALHLKGAYVIGNSPEVSVGSLEGDLTLGPSAAGFQTPWSPPVGEIIGPENIRLVSDGRMQLIVDSTISYTDVFGGLHTDRFAFGYDSRTGTFERTIEERQYTED